MLWGVVSASSPVNTPIGYGTAMCRCASGAPAGNGRTTTGSTTSLTSRPGPLRKRASCRWNCYSTARCTASLPTKGGGIVYSKVGKKTGYVDKFGNVWVKGPTRTNGEEFEWDVQLTKTRVELFKRSGLSSDGKHLNVSLQGRITH